MASTRARSPPLPSSSRASGEDLTAITISWPDTAPEEIEHSPELCHRLGVTQEYLEACDGRFEEELPLLAWISDEPIADPALLSQFHVAEAAGRRVRVLLGGTGGDELFGGYGHYALPWKKAAYASLPASWQRRLYALAAGRWMDAEAADALLEYRTSRLRWHQRSMTHLTAADEAALHDAVDGSVGVASNLERLFAASSGYDPVNQQMVVDLQSYMPEQLLPMLDRATMAASVEGRVPFVDVPLVEFCMSLRARTKLGWPPFQASAQAWIAERVPAKILRAAKSGMPSHFPTFMERHPDVICRVLLGKDAYARTVLPEEWLRSRLAERRRYATQLSDHPSPRDLRGLAPPVRRGAQLRASVDAADRALPHPASSRCRVVSQSLQAAREAGTESGNSRCRSDCVNGRLS